MIGNVVGNYKITEKIGEGGMGEVFKGIDIMLEREVALKMLRPELVRQPYLVERFRSEAVTLAKLNHPNIAILHSFFRQGDDYFMVMEYVPGETLDEIIRKRGAMSCEMGVSLLCQVLEGIDHAHRLGIIHRDIKPANMMLTDTGLLKVMDFGIARVLGSARLTRQGSVIGTFEYMSPEQIQGGEGDASSDIYSLGILLYEMLTGRVPFSSTSEYEMMRSQIEEAPPPPTDFAPHIPVSVERVIMRTLAKKPEARFQTASEFRAHLLEATGIHTDRLANAAVSYATAAAHSSQPLTRSSPIPPEEAKAEGPPLPDSKPEDQAPEIVLKETRLSSDSSVSSVSDETNIKETRLGESSAAQSEYARINFRNQIAALKSTLKSRITLKHLIGIAVVLVLLVILPLAFISGGGEESPDELPQSSPATSQMAEPNSGQSEDDTSSSPQISPLEESGTKKPGRGKDRPKRPSGEDVAKNPEPASAPPPNTEQPATTAPPQQPTPDTEKRDKNGNKKDTEKQEPNKKAEEEKKPWYKRPPWKWGKKEKKP